jgi:hypothetical protein
MKRILLSNLKLFCVTGTCIFILSGCGERTVSRQETTPEPVVETAVAPGTAASVAEKIDFRTAVAGDWVRTDADYVLQVVQLKDDGNAEVKYLNPKPINVGKATWRDENGFLLIYVELRDVNYPGSNYTLVYNPDKNMLTGQYFQAVEQQTFQVEFRKIN